MSKQLAIVIATIATIGSHAQIERTGASAENAPIQSEIIPEMGGAISTAFTWLRDQQNNDGSFGGGRYGRHVGITSLACLAYLSDGHMPGRGQYGDIVERGLEFVLQNVNETGLIAADTSHGPMYGHGFATLFLGEIYGMTAGGPDTTQANRLHDALVKAVRLIVQTQNPEGGWRYNPVPYDADISVTICQIMALRSARNAGIEVPSETIDRAVEYVRSCQNPDGGFKYQLTSGGSAWPRSAAGVASLYYAGIYEDNAIEEGLEYLVRTAFPGRRQSQGAHYFYGHYYAVQTMYLAGGEHWAQWWPAVRTELLQKQASDGSWSDNHAGSSYGTSMALIILQMPKRYLPIFQK
ncbi:MAG: prenyltransferase/squalene oxidase repeat-containing protein [Phycisphaerales bacterium JB043]